MNAVITDEALRATIRAELRRRHKAELDRAAGVAPDEAPAAVAHPTAQWQRQHDAGDRKGAAGKRVLTRVERLADHDRINHDGEDACRFFLSDWEKAEGVGRGGGSMGERVDGGGGVPGAEDHVVEAITRLREARTAVGRQAANLLDWAICLDISWVEIGRRINVNHETARDWTVAAISVLADHYQQVGRFGKPLRHTIRAI